MWIYFVCLTYCTCIVSINRLFHSSLGNRFSLISVFRYYDDDDCVRYIVIVLSVLFGAGAACGTADFMGESCYTRFPLMWWLCYSILYEHTDYTI